MADRDLIAAIDITIDNVLRGHYDTCAERDAALRKAMRDLRLD